MVEMGVNAFKNAASELSIFVSAMQYKNAGIKLPSKPDRNHIHHLLLEKGFNHKYVTFFCVSLNIIFISLAYFGRSLGPTYLLSSLVGISCIFLGILIYSKKPTTFVAAKPILPNAKTIVQPSTKVVSINTETVTAAAAVAEQN